MQVKIDRGKRALYMYYGGLPIISPSTLGLSVWCVLSGVVDGTVHMYFAAKSQEPWSGSGKRAGHC